MFEASSFRDDFSRHFEISESDTRTGGIGLWFPEGDVLWDADLSPKRQFPHAVVVRPVIAIEDDRLVRVSITAVEILSTLEKCFQHPYIKRLFNEGNATGMYFYMREDRLHLDTSRLAEYIEKTKGTQPNEDDLRNWAHIRTKVSKPLDWFEAGDEVRIHFNIDTGDIIGEELRRNPYRDILYLIDATGKRRRQAMR